MRLPFVREGKDLDQMGDEPRRVTFHFGEDIEVRYATHLPARGDLARRNGELWVATSIEPDSLGGHEAFFERPRDVVRQARRDAMSMRRLTATQRARVARLAECAAHLTERASRLRDRMSR